jgi:hypothetical protein
MFYKIGYGLLKKMGWKGEGFGLGKLQNGPIEPLNINYNPSRIGLGYSFRFDDFNADNDNDNDAVENKNWSFIDIKHATVNVIKILKSYIGSDINCGLVFEKSFTSDQRKLIHKQANRLGLQTKSQGAGNNRFLVVSKKNDWNDIIKSISENSFVNCKFELISKGDLK